MEGFGTESSAGLASSGSDLELVPAARVMTEANER